MVVIDKCIIQLGGHVRMEWVDEVFGRHDEDSRERLDWFSPEVGVCIRYLNIH